VFCQYLIAAKVLSKFGAMKRPQQFFAAILRRSLRVSAG
jgi:hypothetical protein